MSPARFVAWTSKPSLTKTVRVRLPCKRPKMGEGRHQGSRRFHNWNRIYDYDSASRRVARYPDSAIR